MGKRESSSLRAISPAESELVDDERRLIAQVVERGDLVPAILTMGESRRAQADQLMWQIPALSLTAQAFLTTAIFSSTVGDLGRLIASLTAFVFVAAALQSLLKHRYDEGVWSRWLKAFEEQCGLPSLNTGRRREAVALAGGDEPPDSPRKLYSFPLYVLKVRIFGWSPFNNSAFRVWAIALATVVAVDFGLFVASLLSWAGWWEPFAHAAPLVGAP